MKAAIIASTPNALQVAFSAIRTCYSNKNFDEIWNVEWQKYVDKNNDHIRLVKHIVNHGHSSTLEHITFTFSLEGVSRACLAQLTRHRLASYSVRSQRYIKGVNWAEGVSEVEKHPMVQDHLKRVEELYHALLASGFKAEDARMILPNQAATNIIMTINLRSFMNLYGLRKPGTHSQAEIGNLVEMMKNEIVRVEPWIEELL